MKQKNQQQWEEELLGHQIDDVEVYLAEDGYMMYIVERDGEKLDPNINEWPYVCVRVANDIVISIE